MIVSIGAKIQFDVTAEQLVQLIELIDTFDDDEDIPARRISDGARSQVPVFKLANHENQSNPTS